MKILLSHFQEKSNILRKKYNDLYHLIGKIEFIYQEWYVTEWSLFKKYKDIDLYLSNNNNKAILSSKNGNTLEDLETFINQLESRRINRYRNVGGI